MLALTVLVKIKCMLWLILLYIHFGLPVHTFQYFPIHLLSMCHNIWCQVSLTFLVLLWPLLSFPLGKDHGHRESRKQFGKESESTSHHHWAHLRLASLGFFEALKDLWENITSRMRKRQVCTGCALFLLQNFTRQVRISILIFSLELFENIYENST